MYLIKFNEISQTHRSCCTGTIQDVNWNYSAFAPAYALLDIFPVSVGNHGDQSVFTFGRQQTLLVNVVNDHSLLLIYHSLPQVDKEWSIELIV